MRKEEETSLGEKEKVCDLVVGVRWEGGGDGAVRENGVWPVEEQSIAVVSAWVTMTTAPESEQSIC